MLPTRLLLRFLIFVFLVLCLTEPMSAADQQWLRISSDHFIVLTDAGEKKGHEVAARFEQMRGMFAQLLMRGKLRMSEPVEIIAIRSDKDYAQLAPIRDGQPITAPAFFLTGDDRICIVLNLFETDSWRAVEHQFAHYLLNYNYPPTQPWFDEGFAEYFASLYLTPRQAEMGSDPELNPAYQTDLLGNETQGNGLKSFTEILSNPVWLTLPDLFGMKNRVVNGREGTHHTLFYAQSWILVHYLLNKNKLPETGTYFDLVENQKLPVDEAIQKAHGVTPPQFEQAVKEYFRSLTALFRPANANKQPASANTATGVYQFPAPLGPDDLSVTVTQLQEIDARALLAEVKARVPDRREGGVQELQ